MHARLRPCNACRSVHNYISRMGYEMPSHNTKKTPQLELTMRNAQDMHFSGELWYMFIHDSPTGVYRNYQRRSLCVINVTLLDYVHSRLHPAHRAHNQQVVHMNMAWNDVRTKHETVMVVSNAVSLVRWGHVMNVAVAEFMHVQQVCKYTRRLDPTMTVVASQHTTRVPYAFPLSLVVTRDTVLTVCARRQTVAIYGYEPSRIVLVSSASCGDHDIGIGEGFLFILASSFLVCFLVLPFARSAWALTLM